MSWGIFKGRLTIASDIDYEELIAEIYYKGKFVALVSQDLGNSKLHLVFPDANALEKYVIRNVDVNWFQEAVKIACEKLLGSNSSPFVIAD